MLRSFCQNQYPMPWDFHSFSLDIDVLLWPACCFWKLCTLLLRLCPEPEREIFTGQSLPPRVLDSCLEVICFPRVLCFGLGFEGQLSSRFLSDQERYRGLQQIALLVLVRPLPPSPVPLGRSVARVQSTVLNR